MPIHGVRHPIYRNGCLGKQDEARAEKEKREGSPLGLTKSTLHPKALSSRS